MPALTDGKPEDAGMDPTRIKLLHERALEWCDGHRMRSGVLLAARRGKIVFHEACGSLTDKTDSPAIDTSAIFTVASVTKLMTSTLTMCLVEDGLLGLNRPIKEYLPEVSGEGTNDIEVQHLLSHTSGFTDEGADQAYEAVIKDGLSASDNIDNYLFQEASPYFDSLWSLRSTFSPGSAMVYCCHNYNLLGEIVRRISGRSLDAFGRDRLFAPLGMNDTSFIRNWDKTERCVVRSSDRRPVDTEWGAHGLNVTALDMARFCQMFLDKGQGSRGRILSPATVYEMSRNQIPGIGTTFFGQHHPDASWGLGWAIQHDERWKWISGTLTPKGTFYHTGAGGHIVWVDPMNEIVGVYLSVCLDVDFETMDHHWYLDLFQNMVTAAVAD